MENSTNLIRLTASQMRELKQVIHTFGMDRYSLDLSLGAEENFGGIIIKADVKYKRIGDCELNFILKCASPSETLRKLMYVHTPYIREIYLYSKVLPEFVSIQKEFQIKKPFESYATYYSSLKIDREEMIILQNMKTLGLKQRERHLPLDYNHVLLTVKEYARLHALSYALHYHRPELFEELEQNMADPMYFDFKLEGVRQVLQHRCSEALKALSPTEDQSAYQKLLYFSDNAVSIVIKLLNSANPHRVVSHIDCGIPNLLFEYENASNAPIRVIMLDWQASRMESPAVDLVTFLFSATDKATRYRYNELISEYYGCLCSFLAEFGCDGKKLLPFEVLQQQLKEYGIMGLFMVIGLIYVYSTVNQRVPDIYKEESHAEGLSFLYDLDDSSCFSKRVREAILDFHNLGYNFS
ncbi:uncharacterized protein LOC116171416 isoform X2 [Photinus pyralis]|uniref:CHK kinase-like domain-containing protein n=4 Tax=Photinus pyralis TaxID=7054 RepID=A0A1Y1MDZ0_PHOPY|nr:uncharacterized protein LOC116171416 isoform X2 [Photinus pyralis]